LHQQVINMPIGNSGGVLSSREVSEIQKKGSLCSGGWVPVKYYAQWTGDSWPEVLYRSDTGLYTWICVHGRKRSTNYAYNGQICNPTCGSSDGQTFAKRPLVNLCSPGAMVSWLDVKAADGTWDWNCEKGDVKQSCSATEQTCVGKYEYYCKTTGANSCENKCDQKITQSFVPMQVCSTDNNDTAMISKSEYDNNKSKHASGEPDTCVDKQIKCPVCNDTIYETN
jgi:hypothetical protein